jgi:CopG family transcriptional regulator, nickel-responsive regulator
MMERVSVTLDAPLRAAFGRFLSRHRYANRSEGVRDLIRKALVADEWQTGRRDIMGVISLVYDHHQPGLVARITHRQHDSAARIISSTHVHMDHRNCLEVVIVKGKPAAVRGLADGLLALRGVKNGSLTAATTGRRWV